MEKEKENTLLVNKHILLCTVTDKNSELEYIKQNFCGLVFNDIESFNKHLVDTNTLIYLCGNIDTLNIKSNNVLVIKEFSTNYSNDSETYKVISYGQVPINVNNVGVYFRNFFDSGKDYFNLINLEHKFQALTESNKPGTAFRSGIYLTKVQEDANNEEIKFKLLRCSSNLSGPTDNFRATDTEVVDQVNEISKYFFKGKTELNHVLAQIYENKSVTTDNKTKEKKAKIKKHSDKTKDMPRNGLMAFCTFYKTDELNNISKSKTDAFDYCYHDTSVLTTLRFELKKMVTNEKLKKKFDVVLYPNSVFIMSLDMNRLYTHAIAPSSLPVDKLPTRLGYIVRCSKTDAVFKDGQTYIVDDGKYVKLEEQTDKGVKELKDLYFKENATDEMIHYGKFHFSLNSGDYLRPLV